MRTEKQLDRSLARRFGRGIDDLINQGNRIGDRKTGRFIGFVQLRRVFEHLTPHEARRADKILDKVAAHANAIGSSHPDDDGPTWWDDLADAIADALAECARTAEAIKGTTLATVNGILATAFAREEMIAEGVSG